MHTDNDTPRQTPGPERCGLRCLRVLAGGREEISRESDLRPRRDPIGDWATAPPWIPAPTSLRERTLTRALAQLTNPPPHDGDPETAGAPRVGSWWPPAIDTSR